MGGGGGGDPKMHLSSKLKYDCSFYLNKILLVFESFEIKQLFLKL